MERIYKKKSRNVLRLIKLIGTDEPISFNLIQQFSHLSDTDLDNALEDLKQKGYIIEVKSGYYILTGGLNYGTTNLKRNFRKQKRIFYKSLLQ